MPQFTMLIGSIEMDNFQGDGVQDIIIRFKSHSAKEEVYRKRQNITRS